MMKKLLILLFLLSLNCYGQTNTYNILSTTASGQLSSTNTWTATQTFGYYAHSLQELDTSLSVQVPTTGGTVVIAAGTETVILNPAGTLASLTVTLPSCSAAYNGALIRFDSSQLITALTVSSVSTVSNAPTAITAIGQGYEFMCQSASTTWFRLY